jgi:hypothetical protein
LPELLRESVKGSHDPSLASSTDEVSRSTIKCVALSGRLADMWCHQQPEVAIQSAIQSSKELLDIEPDGVMEVAKQIAEGIPDMSSFFQISLGKPEEIQKVLDLLEQVLTGIPQSEIPEPVPAS